ncbi:TPA: hypothetical protein QC364_000725 [Bacillus cereus]|nr:hypothetical protein [Bacillus cereus]
MFKDIGYKARLIAIFTALTCRDIATVHPPSDSNHPMLWMVFGKLLWMTFIYVLTLCTYEAIKSIFVKEN